MKTKLFISIFLLCAIALSSCQTKKKDNQMDTAKSSISDKTLDSLISLMTLDEKLSMIHASSSFTSGGVARLGIPELVMSDGPHGVRHEHGRGWSAIEDADDKATYLPVGFCLSSTWI